MQIMSAHDRVGPVDQLFEDTGRELTHIGLMKKIKLWNKNQPPDFLAKHQWLATDKVEHSRSITLENLVARSNEESAE